jgi:hypothetical protein
LSFAKLIVAPLQFNGDVVFSNGKWYAKAGGTFSITVSWSGGASPYSTSASVHTQGLQTQTDSASGLNETSWTSKLFNISQSINSNVTGLAGAAGSIPGAQDNQFPSYTLLVRAPTDPVFGGGGGGTQTLGSILLQANPLTVSDQTTQINFSGVTKDTSGAFIGNVPLGITVDGVVIPNTIIATSDANGVFSFSLTEEQTRTYQVFNGAVFSNAVNVLFQTAGGGGGGSGGGGGGAAVAVITLPFFMGFIAIFYRDRKKVLKKFHAIRAAITRTASKRERQLERALSILRGRR